MSFLDAIKREPVAKPEIVSDLNRYIIEYSKEQERHDGWIHLSQLGVCQRALVFEVANAPMNIKGAGSIQLTFDVGTAVHELVQGYFQRMGNLEGWYKCPNGHKEYGISLKICKTCATIKCDICDKEHRDIPYKYNEAPIVSTKYYLKGRADGILLYPNTPGYERVILEIKTARRIPLELPENYLNQVNLYMGLLKIHNTCFLYFDKINDKFQSFWVKFDEQKFIKQSQRIQQNKEVIDNYKANHILPHRECNTFEDGNKCAFQRICFDEKVLEKWIGISSSTIDNQG